MKEIAKWNEKRYLYAVDKGIRIYGKKWGIEIKKIPDFVDLKGVKFESGNYEIILDSQKRAVEKYAAKLGNKGNIIFIAPFEKSSSVRIKYTHLVGNINNMKIYYAETHWYKGVGGKVVHWRSKRNLLMHYKNWFVEGKEIQVHGDLSPERIEYSKKRKSIVFYGKNGKIEVPIARGQLLIEDFIIRSASDLYVPP